MDFLCEFLVPDHLGVQLESPSPPLSITGRALVVGDTDAKAMALPQNHLPGGSYDNDRSRLNPTVQRSVCLYGGSRVPQPIRSHRHFFPVIV